MKNAVSIGQKQKGRPTHAALHSQRTKVQYTSCVGMRTFLTFLSYRDTDMGADSTGTHMYKRDQNNPFGILTPSITPVYVDNESPAHDQWSSGLSVSQSMHNSYEPRCAPVRDDRDF